MEQYHGQFTMNNSLTSRLGLTCRAEMGPRQCRGSRLSLSRRAPHRTQSGRSTSVRTGPQLHAGAHPPTEVGLPLGCHDGVVTTPPVMTNVRLLGLPETGPNKGRSNASDFAQDETCALSGGVVPATRPRRSTCRLPLMCACVGADFH